MSLSLTTSGLLGATATVAATTIDDAIWLLPYVVVVTSSSSQNQQQQQQQQPWSIRACIIHAVVFMATLESLALVSVAVAWSIRAASTSSSASSQYHTTTSSNDRDITDNNDSDSIVLGSIAALLCWVLAIFFYIQKRLKRQRRERQRQDEERMGLTTPIGNNNDTSSNEYGSAPPITTSIASTEIPGIHYQQQPKSFSGSSIATVISLTTLGALDELSYFPALIVGKIFTPLEICLGTLLAAIVIVGVVSCCLAKCQPFVDCLDRIPIYTVISIFAIVLTISVLYDIVNST